MDASDVGRAVRALRRDKGLTQAEFAERVFRHNPLSARSVSNIEQGLRLLTSRERAEIERYTREPFAALVARLAPPLDTDAPALLSLPWARYQAWLINPAASKIFEKDGLRDEAAAWLRAGLRIRTLWLAELTEPTDLSRFLTACAETFSRCGAGTGAVDIQVISIGLPTLAQDRQRLLRTHTRERARLQESGLAAMLRMPPVAALERNRDALAFTIGFYCEAVSFLGLLPDSCLDGAPQLFLELHGMPRRGIRPLMPADERTVQRFAASLERLRDLLG